MRVGNLSLDDSSHTLRIEGILHQNGDILVANRIDCRRIDHFRTEVTKLRSFHIAQFIDSVCPGNHTRVSCHEPVYIRPDFQTVGIQCGSNDCRCIVGTTSTQVRYLSRHFVCGDKPRNQYAFGQAAECFAHQRICQLRIQHMLGMLLLRLDKLA